MLQAGEAVGLTAKAVGVGGGKHLSKRVESVLLGDLSGVIEQGDDASEVVGDGGVTRQVGLVV